MSSGNGELVAVDVIAFALGSGANCNGRDSESALRQGWQIEAGRPLPVLFHTTELPVQDSTRLVAL